MDEESVENDQKRIDDDQSDNDSSIFGIKALNNETRSKVMMVIKTQGV